MLLYTVFLLVMAILGLADVTSMPSAETSSPGCTLTHTASQPPQIGPVSTVYQGIMTTILYAVDCNLCQVTNTPLALSQGPFTERSTSSMLTITEVRCVPSVTATTRRHDAAHANMAAAATQTAAWGGLNGLKSLDILRRSDQAANAALADLAATFATALPPDVSLLSGGLKDEFTNIASAMFALSVCDSGMDLKAACTQLSTTDVKYNLLQSWYNPDTVAPIVCFCADYGYDFNTTRQQLYSSLYAAFIGILDAAGISTNRTQICENLGLFNRTGPSLGIDIQQYHDLICENLPAPSPTTLATPTTPTTPTWYCPTPVVPYVSNNMTTWGIPTSWGPNATISGTSGPTSWGPNMTIPGTGTTNTWTANATISDTAIPTTWAPNVTVSGTGNGSSWGPPVSFTGTIEPDWSLSINTQTNWTDAQPTGTGVLPTETDSESGGEAPSETVPAESEDTLRAARTPRRPKAMPFYPAVRTPAARPGLFKRY